MKITVDTNILVSATFWKGDSNSIIEKVEQGKIELILSKEILQEFISVLNYKEIKDKIKDKGLEMSRTIEKIVEISTIIEPKQRFNIIKDDPDDNMVIDCAKAGMVDFIVSNDKHLLRLERFDGIKIVTPSELIKSTL